MFLVEELPNYSGGAHDAIMMQSELSSTITFFHSHVEIFTYTCVTIRDKRNTIYGKRKQLQ